ncbi:MAG: hypothetical protein ACTHO8_08740 [Solirubrobacterales bacterium]
MITSPTAPRTIELPYSWAGIEGAVAVQVAVNTDPAALGCHEVAQGFPCCQAIVRSEGVGYDHVYGWLQVVDESFQPGFRIDEHPAFASSLPFLSIAPLAGFFDGPHTDERDWDFVAHTFLCGKGGLLHQFRKEARAILGFRWGFSKHDQRLDWFGPERLSAEDWDGHLERLAEERREWSFKPGFSQHPLDS